MTISLIKAGLPNVPYKIVSIPDLPELKGEEWTQKVTAGFTGEARYRKERLKATGFRCGLRRPQNDGEGTDFRRKTDKKG